MGSLVTSNSGRLALFLLSAIVIFVTMYVLYSGINTLQRLELVESERDQRQRPADVLRALDLREGNVVADLGSGAGYFALKLSPVVGGHGEVLAVDIRKLSLFFLWVRAALRSPHNIHVIVGDEDDPHLPAEGVDGVLIANAYHEFRDPRTMLGHTFRSLRPGGRLVVVDRGPPVATATHGHEVPVSAVEQELQRTGFEIVSREDRLIDRPGDDLWWLLVARKP
jgi:ubiquinone/menaquinone biosynthesis C-methylase UbiE